MLVWNEHIYKLMSGDRRANGDVRGEDGEATEKK